MLEEIKCLAVTLAFQFFFIVVFFLLLLLLLLLCILSFLLHVSCLI